MEAVNSQNGCLEQQDNLLPEESDNVSPYTSDSEASDDNNQSDSFDATPDNGHDLKTDLQQTIPECYKSDLSCKSTSCSELTNDEELQATALCQFMDILNDLDEVLDKSLLACLEDENNLNSDEDDLVSKTRTNQDDYSDVCSDQVPSSSIDDNTQVVVHTNIRKLNSDFELTKLNATKHKFNRVRSKSFSETLTNRETVGLEQSINDGLRSSMRLLHPIVLPSMPLQQENEPLTLPVILFLEHHVNMRPTSAPIQLQVTANINGDVGSAPLIVGRHALLMNRALSLPSPVDSEGAGDWTGRSTARSTVHSMSTSSSSVESLNAVPSLQQTAANAEERNEETEEPPFGMWPHRLSSMLACLSCTIGIFNLSRFAIFSVHFGACFMVQFIILTALVGVPLFTLHQCLGQVLKSGPIDMWKISPIFQGVGISLLITQTVIGVYSIIGLSWIFVYFRDSFVRATDRYKWSMPLDYNSEDGNANNVTFKIYETIPQYFHGEVLQLSSTNDSYFGTIKFQVAFNLAVVWMIVFVALSKGLRSYGKSVYVLIFLPICCSIVLFIKLLTLIPNGSVISSLSDTDWSEFLTNSNSWAAATQETFLTWGLLGVCVMQLTSHKNTKNKTNVTLQNESATIIIVTLAMLLLVGFLANTCISVLKYHGFIYQPGSFENVNYSQFLWPMSERLSMGQTSARLRNMGHYGSLVGVTVWKTGVEASNYSGWQPLAFATQIIPATLAVLPTDVFSPVWAVIFYFILIMFGIAQQLAIWHCVVTGIMAMRAESLKLWETTITFLSCVVGLLFGLLLTTDPGVRAVHFVDYVWTGAWWQSLVQVALACGVFVVRGRPYSGDVVVRALYPPRRRLAACLAALLAFAWNVVLPVVLCVVCVVDFRAGVQRQLYNWRKPTGYWPIWCRQVGVALQQWVLLTVPITAFVQTWRYMSNGPNDILERIQNLYRPRMSLGEGSALGATAARAAGGGPAYPAYPAPPAPAAPLRPDPPPKYTPPPSYSTATGARLLQSLRRSFRTFRRGTDVQATGDTSQIAITLNEAVNNEEPVALPSNPPEYSGTFQAPSLTITDETDGESQQNTNHQTQQNTNRTNNTNLQSTNRQNQQPTNFQIRNSFFLRNPNDHTHESLTRQLLRRSFVRKSDSGNGVRSSLRRSFRYGGGLTTSNEHLVRDIEPISNTVAMSAMLDTTPSTTAQERTHGSLI